MEPCLGARLQSCRGFRMALFIAMKEHVAQWKSVDLLCVFIIIFGACPISVT